MLPKFHGSEHEDPKLHLENFKSTCLFYTNGHSDDTFKYNFFPLSLCGVADDWYRASRWSIYIWEELQNDFISTFLPNFRNFTFRFQIRTFCYKKGEVFYKCWERFKNLLETFPNHGLELEYILSIFCNALPCELYREFDKSLGREFLDLTPEEAWSFFEFFYEHTKPQEEPQSNFEAHTLKSHTEPFPYAPSSLDPYDSSLGSSACVEPDYSDFACPNLVPTTEDLLHQLLQQQLALEEIEGQISRLTQVVSTTQSENLPTQTELSTSDTTIGTEWDNCPNYTGDNVGNEHLPHFPLDSPIQDISLPLTESQGDMQSFPTLPDSPDLFLESRVHGEPNCLDIACPNPTLLTEGQFEEPQDYCPTKSNKAQVESLYEQLQYREEINLKANSSAHETSTYTDSTLDDSLFESTACPYVRPLTEAEIAESRAFLLLAQEKADLKTLNFEWSDCSDNSWDNEGDEPFDSFSPNSNIHETSVVESLEDMSTNTTTELDAQPTPTTLDLIESPLTPTKHLNVTWPEEHIIESVNLSSLHYTPEFESGAHLSPHDLAPSESLTMGIVSDYHEIDHRWGKVVDTEKACIDFLGVERSLKPTMSTSIDFLGVEGILENTPPYSMFTYAYNIRPYLGFKDLHKAIHSPVFSTLGAHSSLVLIGPKENILFLKPFGVVWERLGVG